MSGDVTLFVQPATGFKVAPCWSENLGLPEVQRGLDRVALSAGTRTLARLMETALAPTDADVLQEALEALDQVIDDPVEREAARRDLLRQIHRKAKRPAWSTPAAAVEIRQGVSDLLAALQASDESFAAYGAQARDAVVKDLQALLGALKKAEAAKVGVRFEV